jgi:hypothetical protein
MIQGYNCIITDIDGVLNNYESRKERQTANFHSKIFSDQEFVKDDFNFDPKCLEALNSLIASLKNPKLVISSDWRYHTTPRHFHDMFDVVGVTRTPISLIGYSPFFGINGVHGDTSKVRGQLIQGYVNSHDDILSWCAIDDRKDLFEDGFKNVVFTDPHKGLTEDDVKEFLKKVTHENPEASAKTS